jgi:hypothetical protein
VRGFNFFEPQFAIALAATYRRQRLDKGAHTIATRLVAF